MFKIVAVLIIAMGMLSSVIYTTTIYFKSFYVKSTQTLDSLNIKNTRNKILKSVIYDENYGLIMPAGNNTGTFNAPPDEASVFVNNEYVYCPYAQNNIVSGTTYNVKQVVGSYNVGVINNTITSGKNYVISSPAPIFSNIAFILIKPKDKTNPPACNDIEKRENGYGVDNGSVEVVFFNEILNSDIIKKEVVEISNSNGENINTYFDKMNTYQNDELNIMINKSENNPILSATLVNQTPTKNKSIYIRSNQSGTKTTLTGSTSTIVFEGFNVEIKDIIFTNGTKLVFKNSNVILKNTTLPNLYFEDSKVNIDTSIVNNYMTGNDIINAINSEINFTGSSQIRDLSVNGAVKLYNSKMFLKPSSLVNVYSGGNIENIILNNSNLGIYNARMNYYNTSKAYGLITVDLNSNLYIDNSILFSVFDSQAGILANGNVNIRNSTLTISPFDNGIITGSGASLTMNGTTLTAETNGISDLGYLRVSGSGNSINALNCVKNGVFEQDQLTFDDKVYNNGTGTITTESNTINTLFEEKFNKLNFSCNI